jgi:hypothetical protein
LHSPGTPDAQFLFSSALRLSQSLANRILSVEAQTLLQMTS